VLGSVRARTTLAATVVTGVALGAGSIALLATLHTSLLHADDALSKSRLRDLISLAQTGDLPRLIDAGDGVVQVVDGTGRVRAASANIVDKPALTTFRPPETRSVVLAVVGPDDDEQEHYRLWARRAVTPLGELRVFSGSSTESVTEADAAARRLLMFGLPVTVAVLVLAIWVLVGRALRPVEAIRAEVAGMTDRRLDRRVPEPDTDDEIGRLARTMNAMLDRLEDASRKQRAFVADASHDLQSPLAAIRAEVETQWFGETQGSGTPAGRILAEARQMEALVQNLLYLARVDDGVEAPHSPVDLDDVVLEEVRRLQSSVPIRLSTKAVSGAPVLGNRADLGRAVRNLLENAVRHARSSVDLRLTAVDGVVRLDVADDGPGVAQDDRTRIFDRFFKADAARERGVAGSGLGLPIARAIVEAHGGVLELADADAGARFELRLPLLEVG
jgi:signal transduction histidine kinase